MSKYAELEIILQAGIKRKTEWPPSGPRDYRVTLRFTLPNALYRAPFVSGTMRIDFEALENSGDDYGKVLSNALFASPELRDELTVKLGKIFEQDGDPDNYPFLRVVLSIDKDAAELHYLGWEQMVDIRNEMPLTSKRYVGFSRYLRASTGEQPMLRQKMEKEKLSALVALANPPDLSKGNAKAGGKVLHPLDMDAEKTRSREALSKFVLETRITTLAREDGQKGVVSLRALTEKLEKGCDILYLACHGNLDPNIGPLLLLEMEGGDDFQLTSASELVKALADLAPLQRPRLILLASCQSAGEEHTSDYSGALRAIGPKLAELGIPAVIAMQGDISMTSARELMSKFFAVLDGYDGQIDRAMAYARSNVALQQGCTDWWRPVLYLGLAEGQLWYNPFADNNADAQKLESTWATLKKSYGNQKLIPVLGPGLNERILGSRHHFSTILANATGFPLDQNQCEEIEFVTLFTESETSREVARDDFLEKLKNVVWERHQGILKSEDKEKEPNELILRAAEEVWKREPGEAYKVLASLDLPLFISATPDRLLAEAMRKLDTPKNPREIRLFWRSAEKPDYDIETMPAPSVKEPWIFYLFGRLDVPDSLVLTLDDFVEYLIFVNKEKRIPLRLWQMLQVGNLLFLGFDIHEWYFRILLRQIIFEGNLDLFKKNPHLAVQIDPRGERIRNPEKARAFLRNYISQNFDKVIVFFIRAEEFINNLAARVKKGGGG